MKQLLTFVLVIFLALPASARNWFVNNAAAGSNNGSDWNNGITAIENLNWSAIAAGDHIIIAGSTTWYGKLTIDGSGSAGNRIYVERARATNSACTAAAGWSASYDSSVFITNVFCQGGKGDYVTIDGHIPYTGIRLTNTYAGLNDYYIINLNRSCGNYMEILNLDCHGIIWTNVNADGDVRCLSKQGNAIGFRMAYCSLGGAVSTILTGDQTDAIIEHCIMDRNLPQNPLPTWHPNGWCLNGGDTNITFRFNFIREWAVEFAMFNSNGGRPSDGVYVYGNIFCDPVINPDGSLNVPRLFESQHGITNYRVVFAYNTCININGFAAIIRTDAGGGGFFDHCSDFGNIFIGCQANANCTFSKGANSFNAYSDFNLTDASDVGNGANTIYGASSSIFSDYASRDGQIVATVGALLPRDKGTNAGSLFQTDHYGNTRGADGAWDIGAVERQGTNPPPPTGLRCCGI